jgi:hypothetical protein
LWTKLRTTKTSLQTADHFREREKMMFSKISTIKMVAQIAAIAAMLGIFGSATAADDDKWPPAVTSDGLNLVEGTKAAAVWAKEGADFSEYKRVMILNVGVGFKKNWRRDYNRNEVSLSGQVSKSDAEKIKERVSDEFKKVFTEELEKAGYEVADYDVKLAEADILVLRPAIMDLDVTAPDVDSAMGGHTFTAHAGSMTLYMEFYDSVTSAILARVVDRQNANDAGMVQMSNRVTNRAEADRIFKKWTALLIAKMDSVMNKEE